MTAPSAPTAQTGYLDGAWHRLHPATPLLRGGIWLLAVATYVVVSFRDRLIGLLIGQRDAPDGDPVQAIQHAGLGGTALLIIAGLLVVLVALFWVSWRTSEFRVDGEAVQVRHGVLNRVVRTAKLDRIQGVTITRPALARLLGAARIELDVAGHNANVRLEYLANQAAEGLRRDVLRLASGVQREEGQGGLDRVEGPAVPLLTVTPGRALGAVLLHQSTITFVVVIAVIVALSSLLGPGPALVAFVPTVFSLLTVIGRRTARLLRFSVVGTDDGVRIGSGLLSTSNQAVPPGRIHAVRIEQPLLWRPFGWWRVTVNRASREGGRRREDTERSVAPVADLGEVLRLLPHLVPGLRDSEERLVDGLTGRGDSAAFVPAPRRARWLRPLAWRRTGFGFAADSLLLRGGWLRRHCSVLPVARMQSVALVQGPAERLLRVATVHPHVVSGPVPTRIELVDIDRAVQLFDELAEIGRQARAGDRSHRWAERVEAVVERGR